MYVNNVKKKKVNHFIKLSADFADNLVLIMINGQACRVERERERSVPNI